MPGSPQKRERDEKARLNGEKTTPEPTGEPKLAKDGTRRGANRERMLELVERRRQLAAEGNKDAMGGRPRTRFSRKEIMENAIAELEPAAIKVLRRQLKSDDERVAQSAAIKVLEYSKGKPTQTIKTENDHRITAIRFETAALIGAPDFSDVIEVESEEEIDNALPAG